MRYFYALSLLLALGLGRSVHAQQPFLKYGVTVKVATLSNGRFQEFFTNDSLRRIGSAVYDTRLHRVAYLLPPDSLVGHAKAEITSRWISPDPLAEKFMYESPYNFVSNNPVNKFDPDGRSGIAAIDAKNHTVTVTSTMYFYGSSATADFARNTAASIQNQWNGANGTVKIGGESYKVSFAVKGVAVSDDAFLEVLSVPLNNSLENNYIRVEGATSHDLTGTSSTDRKDGKSGGNTGYWSSNQNKENKGTTAAHEYGHGLGLRHPSTGGRGGQKPNIMMTINNSGQVDPQYVTHTADGTQLDDSQRKVTQENIDQVFTPEIRQNLQQNGTTGIGVLSNEYHRP